MTVLVTKDFRINIDHPPLANVFDAILPKIFLDPNYFSGNECFEKANKDCLADRFLFEWNTDKIWEILFLARATNLIFYLGILILIFLVSKKLFGEISSWFAFFLAIFWPNFLSNGITITTDMASGFFSFACFSFLILNLENLNKKIFNIKFGILLGLGMLTKYSFVSFLPIVAFAYFWKAKKPILNGAISALTMFFIISAGYLFQFKSWAETPKSSRHTNWYENLKKNSSDEIRPIIKFLHEDLKTPFVYWYRGFVDNGFGQYYGTREKYSFFLGKQSTEGFKLYFLFSFFVKNTISTSLLFFYAIYFSFKKTKTSEEKLLIGTIIFYSIILSISKINLGYRHGIIVDPIIILFISQIFKYKKFFPIFSILIISGITSVISKYPNIISYTNELINEKSKFYLFRSSNIEWGQDDAKIENFAKKFQKKTEKRIFIYNSNLDIEQIAKNSDSYILIGSNALSGSNPEKMEKTKILREKTPIYVLYGSWFLYEV
ncbi:MAG: hypothetical protein Fur0024_1300 [Patescibacteria group bacterium]